jgi:hypothetical protein
MTLPQPAQDFMKRYQRNLALRDGVRAVLDECYEFTQPLLERSTQSRENQELDTSRLFNGVAGEELQGFASQIIEDLWPSNARPFDLEAGPDVPPDQTTEMNRRLGDLADDIISTANNSDFRSIAVEAAQDFGIGTGCFLVEEGDAETPLLHTHVPLTEAIFSIGPRGQIDGMFRCLKRQVGDVPGEFPDATLPDALRQAIAQNPDAAAEIIEGTWRDWTTRGTETWRYMCVLKTPQETVLKEGQWTGSGSCPFIAFSFTRRGRECIGRGPIQRLLPDIKTLNKLSELVLENADLAVGGMWQYDDDGVINPDTIRLQSGTLIPRAAGSRGLEPLQSPARFDVSQLVVRDLETKIRNGLYAADLGPTNQTPRSATEVMQRTVDRARRMAGPAGRLLVELLFPYVRRVAWIRQRQLGVQLPMFDGRAVRILPRGPLTRAQAQDEVLRFANFNQVMQQTFGPQATALSINGDEAAPWLAGKIGVAPKLIRDQAEKKALAESIAALAQQAQGAGMDVGGMMR